MRGRSRRAVTTVAGLLPLLAFCVTGCGPDAQDRGAPPSGGAAASADARPRASSAPPAPRPLTDGQTTSALIGPSDLAGTWTTTSEDLSPDVEDGDQGIHGVDGDTACDEVVAASLRAPRSTATVSRTMRQATGQSTVGVVVQAYADVEGAQRQVEQVRQLQQRCSGATVESWTVEYAAWGTPPRGDDSHGIRMHLAGKRFDEVVIRVGTATLTVTFAGTAGDDTALVEAVTARATEKLRSSSTG
ncbi:hypothetical protein [Streptomyces sp. NPDC048606]|uniref:hypothetical protein n=1 Tax=Streptomyces sp. NPDC048606 TaxID=3154726 RepID=UPI00341E3C24